MNTIIRSAGAAVLAAAAAAASPAFAADTSSTLEVSATVTANCVVSTTAVAFGNVDVTTGQAAQATGALHVTCTSGTAWSAAADAGAGTGATVLSRKMADGANLLGYRLFTNAARTTIWGDGVEGATESLSGVGTGSSQTRTIYGEVQAGQTGLPAGVYGDTVQVTVTY